MAHRESKAAALRNVPKHLVPKDSKLREHLRDQIARCESAKRGYVRQLECGWGKESQIRERIRSCKKSLSQLREQLAACR
jgi:chromosome segregation ATPase